ncbi:MAG: hypothetical protein OK438_01390 [Thaumarchaeota archaeon]|nr:hypothetical protein [Nitrososphaerota archaeon]
MVSAMASESDRVAREIVQSLNEHEPGAPFESPITVVGRSGVRHSFSFGSKTNEGANVVGDIIFSSSPIDETRILSLYIKVYDVGAKRAILCALPSITPEARKLSDLYSIAVVESPDEGELAEMVSKTAQKHLKSH